MKKRYKKVFLHGWATDKRIWDRVIEEGDLSIELPSHGHNKTPWDEPTFKPALEELSEYTEGKGGLICLGWSLGAMVILEGILNNSIKPKAIVLIGTTPSFIQRKGFPHGQKKSVVKRMLLDVKKEPEKTLKRFYRLNFTEDELKTPLAEGFLDLYEKPALDLEGIIASLKTLMDADMREKLKSINTPTLIIHGRFDNIAPVEAGEYLRDNIRGAKLMVFEKNGHAPFVTDPEGFKKRVAAFLKDI